MLCRITCSGEKPCWRNFSSSRIAPLAPCSVRIGFRNACLNWTHSCQSVSGNQSGRATDNGSNFFWRTAPPITRIPCSVCLAISLRRKTHIPVSTAPILSNDFCRGEFRSSSIPHRTPFLSVTTISIPLRSRLHALVPDTHDRHPGQQPATPPPQNYKILLQYRQTISPQALQPQNPETPFRKGRVWDGLDQYLYLPLPLPLPLVTLFDPFV